jgi:hypothetical protein
MAEKIEDGLTNNEEVVKKLILSQEVSIPKEELEYAESSISGLDYSYEHPELPGLVCRSWHDRAGYYGDEIVSVDRDMYDIVFYKKEEVGEEMTWKITRKSDGAVFFVVESGHGLISSDRKDKIFKSK